MGLNEGEREDVRNFLLSRGLAFKPLLDEMSDHIGCDLEKLMREGMSYEEAWKHMISQLPEDHFKQIQSETMETINQHFTLSRVFTYVALGALFLTAIFKINHLPGTSELTLLSMMALAASMVSGSVSGIYLNRDKEGSMRVMGLVAGIILMMTGYTFKIMHLAGADGFIMISVGVILVAMLVNTIYVYRKKDGTNLFTFLHEKYTPGIERFLLLLVIPILFSRMIHIILVFAAGLQFIALTWRYMEQDPSKRNVANLVGIILAFSCLMIPMMGEIVRFEVRLAAIVFFNLVGAFLSMRFSPSYFVFIAPVMFILTSMDKLGWDIAFLHNLPFNIIICAVIGAGIYLAPKHSVTRTFMILSLAYLLEI